MGSTLLNQLGWSPQVQLEQGLKNAYAQMLTQVEFLAK
jgi:nucleoside-diphosphate-sugar epimerase